MEQPLLKACYYTKIKVAQDYCAFELTEEDIQILRPEIIVENEDL